jgi:hypothetical protein
MRSGSFFSMEKVQKQQQLHFLHLNFVLVEEHVGDAVGDGELSARLWADEVAVDHLDLEEDVVRLLKKLLVILIVLGEGVWQVAALVELLRGAAHLGPVKLGDHAGDEVGVEVDLKDLNVLGLEHRRDTYK